MDNFAHGHALSIFILNDDFGCDQSEDIEQSAPYHRLMQRLRAPALKPPPRQRSCLRNLGRPLMGSLVCFKEGQKTCDGPITSKSCEHSLTDLREAPLV